MGNVFSVCCDKKSHTPYDPFIYDEEYEEYHSPNILNPNVINTYNPPAPILLEQYKNTENNIYPHNNNPNAVSIDMRDSYYTPVSLSSTTTTTTTTTTFNQQQNIQQQYHNYQGNEEVYQPFSEIDEQEHDRQNEDVKFDINTQDVYTQPSNNNQNINNSTNDLPTIVVEQGYSTLELQQPPQLRNLNNNNNNRNLQNSSQDKFYPRYMNFTESVYMAQPPSNDLGNTDSIVDSLVFGLEKQQAPKQLHHNTQHLQPNYQHQLYNNNSNNNTNTSTPSFNTNNSNNNNNNNNNNNQISNSSTFQDSTVSSSSTTNSMLESSIYYDAE